MTNKQRREHKQGNQRRKAKMLADKTGPQNRNGYSSAHYGFVQNGKYSK